jgi:hypothetical protein
LMCSPEFLFISYLNEELQMIRIYYVWDGAYGPSCAKP